MGGKKKKSSRANPLHLVLGIALIVFGFYAVGRGVVSLTDNKIRLFAPEQFITVEVADTDETRVLGLSGRESIDDDYGMLFVFDSTGPNNCFWMKDMQFAIDMVWLDDSKTVLNYSENVEPDTYPETFCPDGSAKYGLELNAYQAENLGIDKGVQLRW